MKKTYSQFKITSKQIEGKQFTLLVRVCLPMQMAPMNPCELNTEMWISVPQTLMFFIQLNQNWGIFIIFSLELMG